MIDDEKTIEFIDQPQEKKENGKKNNNNLKDIIDGTILTREIVVKQFPFILFLTFLALVYIANRYNAEKLVRNIVKTQRHAKELRYEAITVSSELMSLSKQSSVSKLIREKGMDLNEPVEPAKRIIIDKDFK